MSEFEYVGCFLDCDILKRSVDPLRIDPLKNNKLNSHVTFEYLPDHVFTELFGTAITVTIIGYGNDGENEGLQVTLTSDNDQINEMIQNIPVPHITLAVSDGGYAVNTRYLHFSPIEPITIVGHYGGHQNIMEEDT